MDFEKQWKEIDSLIVIKSLPKTALQKVDIMYEKATKQQLHAQIIKALLYKLSLADQVDEQDINKDMAFFRDEIRKAILPAQKSVLLCLQAKQLYQYYNNNRYRLYQRSKTTGFKKEDIATWSHDDFHKAITELHHEALKPAFTLQQTSLPTYDAIIIKGNVRELRPTLYDLIAHIALDYFKSGDYYVTRPTYAFVIKAEAALAKAIDFIHYDFRSADSLSHQLLALQLFQRLMQFHQKDADPSAFIDVDLERIQWVIQNAVMDGKGKLYQNALTAITQNYPDNASAQQAWYLLAKIYADKAATYKPFGDTTHRYDYLKAKQIIDARLAKNGALNEGVSNMQQLLQEMNNKELNTEVENVNIPGQPFRMFVQYKNVDSLFGRIIRLNTIKNFPENNWDDTFWKALTKLKPYATFTQTLPQTNDFQQHATEIRINALPPGNYALIASSGKDFKNASDKLILQYFDVSNISYIKNGDDYFALHRETGKPIEKLKVRIDIQQWNAKSRKYVYKKAAYRTPDQNGLFRLPELKEGKNDNTIQLRFYAPGDTLDLKNDEYYNPRRNNIQDYDEEDYDDDNEYEEDNAKAYFFTDRSIYRPGQTIYFKGIVFTKERKTKKAKLYPYKDSIKVILRDVNNQKLDSLKLVMNDYSSFSGKFKLPENALTGEFTIETLEFDGEANFHVEEYKRPKFYVELDTLKSTYRLNDTIKITGYAKAYAGNAIDGAQVKFNVSRTAQFPYSWLFWRTSRPYSSPQQIADSTITTDENGRFEISFIATPDASIDKNTEPVFDFEIEIAVTDINGETREKNTKVSIGYKSLLLQMNVPKIADLATFKNIELTTQNLAGQKVPASVQIKISPLQTPDRLTRKRYWSKPDQFAMSKAEFLQYFPYDEYNDETDYQSWPKQQAVITENVTTDTASKFNIHPAALIQGWYVIEATAKDKDGQEIKEIKYIQLYDIKSASLPAPQYNWSNIILNSVQPGDTAKLLIGSSSNDLFLVQNTVRIGLDKKQDSTNYNFQFLNGKRQFELPVTESDRGGIGMYYAFVKHNRFYSGGMNVYVPYESKDLQISYESYRDKTEPGSKEKWTVKISGKNDEKLAAELLTGMYDGSLDQFKEHNWQVPDVFPAMNYINNSWEGRSCFTTTKSTNNWPYKSLKYFYKTYDRLAENGRELWGTFKNRQTGLQDSIIGVVNQEGMLNDVVVFGYGVQRKVEVTGSLSTVVIRGSTSIEASSKMLIVVDGIPVEKSLDQLPQDEIENITLLKGTEAISLYGARGANGVVLVTTKAGAARKKQEEDKQVQVRKNFNETAFFFPQLYADTSGNYRFSFTMPEALTQWKWMSFAHTKELAFGLNERTIITQKTLMVQPNIPRFLRQGDQLEFSAKISNLSDSEFTGQASLQLIDAITNTPVDGLFHNVFPNQYFTAGAGKSASVKFPVSIPFNYDKPVTIRIIARAEKYSDGEENTLPVLTNRMLVTETLPLYVKDDTTKHFSFDKLLNNNSPTLQTQSLTVEYTSNPVWYAVQSLPYLMEYPYECSEQTFNRFFANALATYIVGQHPRIKAVFEQWKNDTAALLSNLQKNEELKQILIQETPWVLQAENEAQQKKNIALLFDVVKMNTGLQSSIEKLKQMQLESGGFPWFKGGREDRYITQYILTGIGRLIKLNAVPKESVASIQSIIQNAISYLDDELMDDYKNLKKYKTDLKKNNLSATQIKYLFMRSYFTQDQKNKEAYNYYSQQAKQFWAQQSAYLKAMIGASLYRKGEYKFVTENILPSILENAVESKDAGMYWKDATTGYYWHQAPTEQQALMIELINEIAGKEKNISLQNKTGGMQTWLLRQKQTTNWKTTKATADACFALLLNNSNTDINKQVTIQLGDRKINSSDEKTEAGTGYFKTKIDGNKVTPELGSITVQTSTTKPAPGKSTPSWGAVYWQYFEDLDKITAAATPLSLTKKLFVENNSSQGKTLTPVNENDELKVGDKLIVRIILKSDRDMEYLHLKDMRAATMEPVNVLSGYKWQDGLGYYEATKDASTNFFISYLNKGTYVFEYPLYVTHTGNFSVGVATIQCMYAPEFTSHSEGLKINVAATEKEQ